MLTKFQFKIEETVYRNRLDFFLFNEILPVSKMYLRALIKNGACKINGSVELRGGYHLKRGDAVEIAVDLEAKTSMLPENIPLEIVFEDEEIILVNKPSGLLVHPTAKQKTGTLLNALAFYLNIEDEKKSETENENRNPEFRKIASGNQKTETVRAGLIHRLDRETSGLLVVAKTSAAHRFLSRHFQNRLVEKKYLALVEGKIENDEGVINAPVGRIAEEKRWGVKEDGKPARTVYKVVKRFEDKTLLSLEPETGRTNQLRIHCAFLGHPIIGDKLYGGREFHRLCLHAAELSFYHPKKNERIRFEKAVTF